MNTLQRIGLSLSLTFIFLADLRAGGVSFVPVAPQPFWDKTSDGIGISFHLQSYSTNADQKDAILVFIQNMSSRPKEFNFNGMDNGIHIFYLLNDGSKMALRHTVSGTLDNLRTLPRAILKVGSVLSVTIDLTEQEVKLLTSNRVQISLEIWDPVSKKSLEVDSLPRHLTVY